VLRALCDANVQFVVVGELSAGRPLRLVVSRHPTNLEALGRVLDRLESTVRTVVGPASAQAEASVRRVGEPTGTIGVSTSGGDVDLIFGGPRHSLYAEVASHARERELGGLRVQWTDELPPIEPAVRVTSRMVGQRLRSLSERLARLVERHDGPGDGEREGRP
jgi:hypothetical protein